jgi:SAM-dependent methyltransferase
MPDPRSFFVGADAYQQFMGRFADPLAVRFADFAGVTGGATALDVGCGTGALTTVLVDRLGAAEVSAVDPSASFVEAARRRLPGVDVRQGRAEDLPFDDGRFDLVLAQLVVHFMTDPVAGLREMARVARPRGVIGAAVWDHGGGNGPLELFWSAVRELAPGAPDESDLPGVREGHLAALATEAGLADVDSAALTVEVGYESFEDWWRPYTLAVGPAGAHVAALDDAGRAALRERCRALLPPAPFSIRATAWAVRARTPS